MLGAIDVWTKCPKRCSLPRFRLFCLPPAGSGASTYDSWAHQVPSGIEICSVRLPGRESRVSEPLLTNLGSLIQILTQVLRPLLNVPFVFFGHSMGALVGFELARQLRKEYLPMPRHLFISGRRAPTMPDRYPPIHHLTAGRFLERLVTHYDTPQSLLQSDELIELSLPGLRADFAICERYVYQQEEPLDCPISVFGGMSDQRASRDELSAWRDQTYSSFRLHRFPGNHFFADGYQKLVLAELNKNLNQLLGTIDSEPSESEILV